jgi:hypothetical protein
MRFSALFQSPERLQQPLARLRSDGAPSPAIEPPAAREPIAPDLPDDLDARVRLVGEWQLGEP